MSTFAKIKYAILWNCILKKEKKIFHLQANDTWRVTCSLHTNRWICLNQQSNFTRKVQIHHYTRTHTQTYTYTKSNRKYLIIELAVGLLVTMCMCIHQYNNWKWPRIRQQYIYTHRHNQIIPNPYDCDESRTKRRKNVTFIAHTESKDT